MKEPFPMRLMRQAHLPGEAPDLVAQGASLDSTAAKERSDELLAAFADLVLVVNAARTVS